MGYVSILILLDILLLPFATPSDNTSTAARLNPYFTGYTTFT